MANITFKEFLIELMVSDDPVQALKDVKQAAQNPDVYKKQQMAANIDQQNEIQKDKNDPLKSDKMRIVKMKQQVAGQESALSQKEKRLATQQGVAPAAKPGVV